MQRLLVLIAAGALAFGLAACGSSSKSSSSSSGTAEITIDSGFTFHTTPVKAGSTVTVKNDSGSDHTVTQDSSGFNVQAPAGKTVTFTAPSSPGSYAFHCNIHTSMHGTLTVT